MYFAILTSTNDDHEYKAQTSDPDAYSDTHMKHIMLLSHLRCEV